MPDGTLDPAQNFDHLLDPKSGYNGMHDLQYAAEIATGEDWYRGGLISLDVNGKFKAGCADDEMPLFAINGTNDTEFDVRSDRGNISGGNVAAYPGICGIELVTTEYDETQVYYPNDFLWPIQATTPAAANLAIVTKAGQMYNDHVIVGCVSRGTFEEIYQQSVLQFWPMFIPKTNATAAGSSSSSSSNSSSSESNSSSSESNSSSSESS